MQPVTGSTPVASTIFLLASCAYPLLAGFFIFGHARWSVPKRYTDAQILSAFEQAGTLTGAAAFLGMDLRGYRRRYKRIREMESPVPDPRDGERVKGRSTLYDAATGEARLEWVKTASEDTRALDAAYQALISDLPKAEPVAAPAVTHDDLLNCYIVTDYHIGMRAWPAETGEAWDTAIAERLLLDWFAAAIEAAPPAKVGVLAQLGDLLHWDGLEAVTPTSGHVLEADTRFAKLVQVSIRVLRQAAAMLLGKHERLHLIMAEGNHDLASSVWLRECFAALYEHEPRITVETSPDPYYCVEHGQTSLFFHHGHCRKMDSLSEAFAGKFRPVFGRTTHSYAHTGHLHHAKVKENSMMTIEQHQTLAAKDAYASRHGYQAGRSAQVITYHVDHGEVGRVRMTPEMVSGE